MSKRVSEQRRTRSACGARSCSSVCRAQRAGGASSSSGCATMCLGTRAPHRNCATSSLKWLQLCSSRLYAAGLHAPRTTTLHPYTSLRASKRVLNRRFVCAVRTADRTVVTITTNNVITVLTAGESHVFSLSVTAMRLNIFPRVSTAVFDRGVARCL